MQLCVFFACQLEYVKATEIAQVKLVEEEKYHKEIQKIRHKVNFALLGGLILYLQEVQQSTLDNFPACWPL